jgi:hypothetical protein
MTHKTVAILSLISLLCAISVCMAQAQSPAYTAGVTGKDGRFVAYNNGTVLDTRTHLLWAVDDNGGDINWDSAKSYCQSYLGGGQTKWRMPTQDELAELYDAAKTYTSSCGDDVHLTQLIRLSCGAVWASDTQGSASAAFRFRDGQRGWAHVSGSHHLRALPVCFVK